MSIFYEEGMRNSIIGLLNSTVAKEILKIFALFRFILPEKGIRTAGGREVNLRDLQAMGLMGGINGMLVGGYLTTSGRNYADDMKMIDDLDLVALSANKC